jgi:hypothetical protein
MTDRNEPHALTAGLGSQWEILAVGFKGYATAGAIHASLWTLNRSDFADIPDLKLHP